MSEYETTPNLAELDAAIADIEAHPERHNQRNWLTRTSCGTAACLAGTVALRHGWKPVNWFRAGTFAGGEITGDVEMDGVIRSVEDVAASILGIGYDDMDELFGSDNTIEDIKRYRGSMAAEYAEQAS
jgi:hypothetical protein